ncbi:MAG TPA: acetolactate decarboxylase [Candidatus Eisenbacteria bacterium]
MLSVIGCTGGGKSSTASRPAARATPAPWNGQVNVAGRLRAMFHEGMTGTTVALDSLLPDTTLYAVGTLSDLAGEVTIARGVAYLSRPQSADSATTEVATASSAGATLLVWSRVPAWIPVPVDSMIPFEEIDARIATMAASTGLNVTGRFPFLVTGPLESIDWHVVDGRLLEGGGESHADHLAASTRLHRDHVSGTIIGFYSTHDEGVFTHMGSATHLHVALDGPAASGHVDHVVIPAGAVIHFPSAAVPGP